MLATTFALCPATPIPIRQIPGFEVVFDVVCRVIANARLGDVGNVSLTTFRVGTAGKALAGDYSAEEIARAVALRTVSRAVDQIGAAIPLRGLGRIRRERSPIPEEKLPAAERAPEPEW